VCFLVGSQKLYVFKKKKQKKKTYIGMESGLFSPGKHIGHQDKKRSHGGSRSGSGRKRKQTVQINALKTKIEIGNERKRKQRHRETCLTYVKALNPFSKNRKKTEGCNAAALTMYFNLYKDYKGWKVNQDCVEEVHEKLGVNKRFLKLLVQGLLDQSKRIKSGAKPIIPFDAPRRRKHTTSFINGSKSLKEKHVAWMCNFLDTHKGTA
jgi:hypothetical protein